MNERQSLGERSCRPCEGGVPALTPEAIRELRRGLHADWAVSTDGRRLTRIFSFSNYYRTIAFVNAVAWIANREDHHPDLEVHYGRCVMHWSTHAIDGLSENDFICAAKVDRLVG